MENLEHEAEGLEMGFDAMMKREVIRARKKGIEDFISVPTLIIEDLTHSIEELQKQIDAGSEGEAE